MAKLPEDEFKLLTEEELAKLYEEKPELLSHTFEGYCIQTGNRLLFGPTVQKANQCLGCFPDSHFVMIPIKYLSLESPTPKRPVLRCI